MNNNMELNKLSEKRNIVRGFMTKEGVGKRRLNLNVKDNEIQKARKIALYLEKNITIPNEFPNDFLDYIFVYSKSENASGFTVLKDLDSVSKHDVMKTMLGYTIKSDESEDFVVLKPNPVEKRSTYFVVSLKNEFSSKTNGKVFTNIRGTIYHAVNLTTVYAQYLMNKLISSGPVDELQQMIDDTSKIIKRDFTKSDYYAATNEIQLNPYSKLKNDYLVMKIAPLIVSKVMEEYIEVIAEIEQDLMNKETNSSYAKKFEDKKNIPIKVLNAMQNSKLLDLQSIDYIELDEWVDLDSFAEIEKTFLEVSKLLPVLPNPLDLRFRRLGDHKALGLYYSEHHCIAVEVRDTSAFVHEYGHAIDYQWRSLLDQDVSLSMSDEFLYIRRMYEKKLRDTDVNTQTTQNLTYYLMPTEIFARSFELYFAVKLMGGEKTSASCGLEELKLSIAHKPLFVIQDEIFRFFDLIMNKIKLETKDKSNLSDDKDIYKVNDKSSKIQQIGFVI